MGHKRVGSHPTQRHFNDVFESLELQSRFLTGVGVLSGCQLAPVAGKLAVSMTEGLVNVEAAKKVNAVKEIPVVPNRVSYIFVSETGQTLVSSSPAPVGGLLVCVGRAVAGNESVILCDGDGRMEPARMNPDDPASFVVRSELLPKGPLHLPVAERFIDEELVLVRSDRNIQSVCPGGQDLKVKLFKRPHLGNWFRIINAGLNGYGKLKIVDGRRVLGEIAPGQVLEVFVVPMGLTIDRDIRAKNAEARKAERYKSKTRNHWVARG